MLERSGGDSVTLIEQLGLAISEAESGLVRGSLPVHLSHPLAARIRAALALLELRESDRQSGAPSDRLSTTIQETGTATDLSAISLIASALQIGVTKFTLERPMTMLWRLTVAPSAHWDEHWPEGCGCEKCVSFRAALIPKKDLLGSASALEVEALRQALGWALEPEPEAKEPIADEGRQHAEWRVRYDAWLDRQADARRIFVGLASATKTEASPSPETLSYEDLRKRVTGGALRSKSAPLGDEQDAELGAAIRPRAEAGNGRPFAILRDIHDRELRPLGVIFDLGGCAELFVFDWKAREGVDLRRLYETFDEAVGAWSRSAVVSTIGIQGTSTTTELSPIPESSRPVSTDEEEGQGFEDGGLQSRPSGGESR